MADQASEFIRQSQSMAQQSWEQWMRYLQQSGAQPSNPFANVVPGFGTVSATPMGDVLDRSYQGIKGYLDWMQRAAGSQASAPVGTDWQEQMQRLFGEASQPFSQAFSGIDSTAAQGFVQQWQAWLAANAQGGGFGGVGDWQQGLHMPAFGLQREQQEQQQALIAAMLDSLEQQRQYQALLAKANAQGLERLQDKLAQHSEPGREIESLKALYDLWIDAAEEAYAEIALSDEFRAIYGAMVNAQMHERALQQKQLEAYCRQLGMPTRSEVDSIGRRLQEVRRELRAHGDAAQAGEIAALRAEVGALKKQLSSKVAAPALTEVTPVSSGDRATTTRSQANSPRKATSTTAVAEKETARKPASRKAAPKKTATRTAAPKSTASKSVASKSVATQKKKAASRGKAPTKEAPRTVAAPAPLKAAAGVKGNVSDGHADDMPVRKRAAKANGATTGKAKASRKQSAAKTRKAAGATRAQAAASAAVRPGFPAPRSARRK